MSDDVKTWWDAFAGAGGLDQLETWLGGPDAHSRLRIRERIAQCEYQSVCDVGAGLGLGFVGLDNISYEVQYIGVEPSVSLRLASGKIAEQYGLKQIPLVAGTAEKIPLGDKSYDLVYARHIFEHLPKIEDAMNEMLRVAALEVIVIFFMRPGKETYLTRERDGLWQNWWSKSEVERTLENNPRVDVWFWETLLEETLLHVYVKGSAVVDYGRVGDRVSKEVRELQRISEPEPEPEPPVEADWTETKNVAPHEAAALRKAGRL